jgi:hypothetical protein
MSGARRPVSLRARGMLFSHDRNPRMQSYRSLQFGSVLVALAASCNSSATDVQPAREHSSATATAVTGPSTTPLKDGVHFSSQITHPYFPLSTVRYAEFRSDDEFVVREVLADTRTIGGVECTVLAEKEHEKGAVAEISYNFFAQDVLGNVYYFGEEVDEYKDGQVSGHGGAWLVGKNATEPCVFMPAQLTVGLGFKNENSPPAAEEWNEIEKTDAKLELPGGSYRDVLVIKEADKPDKWKERKYYAKGVGLISENRELNLMTFR